MSQDMMPAPSAVFASAFILYGLFSAVYRLYLSPLSRFPGPKLAALTHWYEAYYDLFSKGTDHHRGGQFPFKIKKMHQKYGPIVRINPKELHIDDPDYYNEIYSTSSTSKPIDKMDHKHRFNIPGAMFSTVTAEHHRLRRAAVAPFFSKASVQKLNGHSQDIADRISSRLSTEYAGTERVLNITHMWSSMLADFVTESSFGRSSDFSSAPDFLSPFIKIISDSEYASHWSTHFEFLVAMINWVPDCVMGALVPSYKSVLDYHAATRKQLQEIMLVKHNEAKESLTPTVFTDIFKSSLPQEELSLKRLTDESAGILGGAVQNTSWALTVACFFILDKPEIQKRLKAELTEAMPIPSEILPWKELEKLPYLSAVISEALRIGYGSAQRLPRINRLGAWKYGDYEIPAGTPVGMNTYNMHSNEEIFPEPLEFRPERWLGSPKGPDGLRPLSHYLVPFGRGSRACIAIHMSYLELYVAIATIFRRHELGLFETDRSDVDFCSEFQRPMPKRGGKGVRVVVKS